MMAGRFRVGSAASTLLAALLLPLLLSGCDEVGEFFGIGVGSEARPLDYSVELQLDADSVLPVSPTVFPGPSIPPIDGETEDAEGERVWVAPQLSAGEAVTVSGTADATMPETLRFRVDVSGAMSEGELVVLRLYYTDRRSEPPARYYARCYVVRGGSDDPDSPFVDNGLEEACFSPDGAALRGDSFWFPVGNNAGGTAVTINEFEIPYNPPHSRQ